MKIIAERYHDISCGHRVVGHENKCRHLHGHNYRIHFSIEAEELDKVGRVMDFSVIKAKLCQWLEDCFDHKVVDYIAKIRFFQLITTINNSVSFFVELLIILQRYDFSS